MSRIGRKPIAVPGGVKVAVQGQTVNVEGPKGKLSITLRPEVGIAFDDKAKTITFSQKPLAETTERQARSLHGLSRALVNNMVEGVTNGYRFVMTLSADQSSFTVTAVPVAYGKSGRLSFYADINGLHAQDLKGQPATVNAPLFQPK